jgi:predicted small lipoprotein YifL
MKCFVCLMVFVLVACGADGPPERPSVEKYTSGVEYD